jgi:mRNA interferase HigB
LDSRYLTRLRRFTDKVDVSPYTVFDVGGNNYRVITVVRYRDGKIFVRWVMPHREYDN